MPCGSQIPIQACEFSGLIAGLSGRERESALMRKIHIAAAEFATEKFAGAVYLYRQQEVTGAKDRTLSNLVEE